MDGVRHSYLNKFIAAEITTTIRDIASEVLLGEAEGLRESLTRLAGRLQPTRWIEVKRALGAALGWRQLTDLDGVTRFNHIFINHIQLRHATRMVCFESAGQLSPSGERQGSPAAIHHFSSLSAGSTMCSTNIQNEANPPRSGHPIRVHHFSSLFIHQPYLENHHTPARYKQHLSHTQAKYIHGKL